MLLNFAFNFILRHLQHGGVSGSLNLDGQSHRLDGVAATADAASAGNYLNRPQTGTAVQVNSIKTRVESAHGLRA
jgi:hypothetical protein